MSLEQQVGQLFISGVYADAPTQAELDVIGGCTWRDVSTNGSSAGAEVTRQVSDRAQAAATVRSSAPVGLRGPGGRARSST